MGILWFVTAFGVGMSLIGASALRSARATLRDPRGVFDAEQAGREAQHDAYVMRMEQNLDHSPHPFPRARWTPEEERNTRKHALGLLVFGCSMIVVGTGLIGGAIWLATI
jgi:hypothetical protein